MKISRIDKVWRLQNNGEISKHKTLDEVFERIEEQENEEGDTAHQDALDDLQRDFFRYNKHD